MAEERDCLLGTDVGYVVRFDDNTDEETKVKVRESFLEFPLFAKEENVSRVLICSS